MSRTVKSGSSFFLFLLLCGVLFTGLHYSGLFDGARAAANIDIREGRVAGGESRDLRQFVRSNPDNFLMMSGSDVKKAFDAPELSWAEFPGVVWQYRTESCVVDVYFAAMEEDVSDAPVIHYEVRGRGAADEEVDTAACLTGLMRSKGGFFL